VLLLGLFLAVATWREWRQAERAVFTMATGLLGVLMLFYARYYNWWGGASWGSRFTTVPVQLMCLVVGGFVVRSWAGWSPGRRVAAGVVIAAGALANVLAIVFWYQLEIQQQLAGVSAKPVLVLRAMNVAALLSNSWEAWGLLTPSVSNRLMRPNALAWLAQPYLGPWGRGVLVLWGIALILSIACIVRGIRSALSSSRRRLPRRSTRAPAGCSSNLTPRARPW